MRCIAELSQVVLLVLFDQRFMLHGCQFFPDVLLNQLGLVPLVTALEPQPPAAFLLQPALLLSALGPLAAALETLRDRRVVANHGYIKTRGITECSERLASDAIVGVLELLQHRLPFPHSPKYSLCLFLPDSALQHRGNDFLIVFAGPP